MLRTSNPTTSSLEILPAAMDANAATVARSTQHQPANLDLGQRVVPGKPTEALAVQDSQPEVERNVAEDESQYPTGLKFYLILFSIGLVLVFGSMDSSMVSVAVPSITNEFRTVADVGWYSAAFRLARCSTQFAFGKLYKIFSVKRIFLVSVFVFVASSIMCATAATSTAFIVARAVNGFATSGIITGCFTLLVQCFPLRKRPVYTGIFGAIEGVSDMGSPTLGGLIVDKLGWRWCFWISVPSGAATFLALLFTLSDVQPITANQTWRQRLAEMDLLGTMVLIPCLTCLFVALSWAGTRCAWNSPTIVGLFCAFGVLLGLFAYEQYRKGETAALPPRILKNRSVLAGLTFSLCCNSAMSIVEYYLPIYFQTVRQFSAAESGYLIFPVVGGFALATLLAGWGVTTVGYYTPFMLLGSVLMPLFSGLLTTVGASTELVRIVCYAAFYGFAGGIGFQSPQSAVQAALPAEDASIGLSVILFCQQFGPAVFVTAAQTIFTNKLTVNLHELAPGLNATTIEGMGLTDLTAVVGPENLNNVLAGFDKSLAQTWYLAVGLACVTMLGSLGMEWRSVKQRRD